MASPEDTHQAASRAAAEEARAKVWAGASFLRELFLGRYRLDLLEPYPETQDRPVFLDFYARLSEVLEQLVDPVELDEGGEYPAEVIEALADIGAFGMKIPEEYGGLGLTHGEYVRVMELVGSHDANITALLSAHQAIGVPHPIEMFGTEEQKRRFLPRCARGAISAFALTEPAVGSDPARLSCVVRRDPDGDGYVIDGEKLWCTNGTLAELVLVMARHPDTNRISAFVVETSWPGVTVEHRCRFMGLRALANGVLGFRGVRVPRDYLVGGEGDGLRIALATLNTGRLTLPAATAGAALRCLEVCRTWTNARVQWGVPIGEHEAIALGVASVAHRAFAMESVAELVGALADREGFDIRLEAAAAKEWNTTRGWQVIDETLQIRGGRGYETERSLAARGEAAIGVERMLRDARINRIFEGSSEIMHLFIAREAVDRHLQVAGALVDPRASAGARARALPRIAGFYAWWYPTRWIGWGRWPRYRSFGPLARHVRSFDRSARRLARAIFHGMLRYRAGLERRQAFLFRAVDIALEIFAASAACLRARAAAGLPGADTTVDLADVHARAARRRIRDLFRALWRNDDAAQSRLAGRVRRGECLWLEEGAVPLPYDVADLAPPKMEEILEDRDAAA